MRREHFIKQFLVDRRNGNTADYSVPTTTTYHEPSVRQKYSSPPLPSQGNRDASGGSPFNVRGRRINHAADRQMYFDSGLEFQAGSILQTNRNIVELREQWPTVPYTAPDGTRHKHTFDFWGRTADGKSFATAVKPIGRVIKSGVIDTLIAIVDQGIGGVADDVSLVTEAFASKEAAANAQAILLARRMRNEEEYEKAHALISKMRGHIRFRELLKDALVPAHRRTAIWNLIDEGHLVPAAPIQIDEDTLLAIAN